MQRFFCLIFTTFLLHISLSAEVKGSSNDSLKIHNFKIFRVKDTLKVSFDLQFNKDVIQKSERLTLQPYIVGESNSVNLRPLVLKTYKRTGLYSLFRKRKYISKFERDSNFIVTYTASIKLEEWMSKRSWLEIESISDKNFVVYMDRSNFIIDVKNSKETKTPVELITATASNRYDENQIINSTKIEEIGVKSTPVLQSNSANDASLASSSALNSKASSSISTISNPDYSRFPFIVESSKLPEEYYKYEYLSEYGLPLYYEFNDLGLNDYYKNNFVALTKLYEALRKILVKDRKKIKKVVIAGYSSPEGYTVINEDIAKRRGDVLKDRLCKVIGINPDIVEVVNGGENWSGLKSLVEKSNLKDKEDLLNIINYKIVLKEFNRVEDPINSDRERKMLDLNFSASYQYIKSQYFPVIRIAYVLILY